MAAVPRSRHAVPATRIRSDDARPPPARISRAAARAAIRADRLSLRGPRGWVYRDVTFGLSHAGLIAVQGAPGSGRTSLLLTLAGRMRPTSGKAWVDGLEIPGQLRAVQRFAALGRFPGINDVEPGLTVAEQFREAELLQLRLRSHPGVPQALEAWLGVSADTLVRELDGRRRHLLAVAMALVGSPQVILVDDVDVGLLRADQGQLWSDLATVAARGVTVVVSCADVEPARPTVHAIVTLDEEVGGGAP